MPVIEEYKLPDKVAVVATRADGATAYLAEALAEAGARVFVVAGRHEVMEDAVRRARQAGGEAFGTLCESTREDEVEQALADALDHWGRVDILVNNFRTEFAKPFQQVSAAEYDAVMERNVKAVFLLTRAVGARMVGQGARQDR